ncbi:MAG: Hsp20/alpha crystallin family protein [Phycisphaerae bacterium]
MNATAIEVKKTQPTAGEKSQRMAYFEAPADIREDNDGISIWLDTPGANTESVSVTYENGSLSVEASVNPGVSRPQYLLQEYELGSYRRTFRIGVPVNVEEITADLTNGELHVRLPKAHGAKARKITVRT